VRAGPYADDNYGAEPLLVVKAGNPEFTREVYLRFALDALEPSDDGVWLRLRQGELGFGGMRYGIAPTENGWEEDTLTWNTRPDAVEAQTQWWFPEQAGDSLIDVTAWVREARDAGQPLSLRVWANAYYGAPAQSAFGAREGDEALVPLLRVARPIPEMPGTSGGADATGGDTDAGDGGDDTGGEGSSGSPGSADATSSGPGTATGSSADGEDGGCGCRTSEQRGPTALLLLALLPLLRRRETFR